MPTKAEFAASIKAKYPQYKDVADDELVSAMLAKYPQYKSQIEEPKGPDGVVSPEEPGTFWGGFTKSLKDQVLKATVGNPMLQAAAHPQTTGDFLSLVLPSEIGEAYPAAVRAKDAMVAGARESQPGILNTLKGAAKGFRDRLDTVGMADQTLQSRNMAKLPLIQQMDHLPTDIPADLPKMEGLGLSDEDWRGGVADARAARNPVTRTGGMPPASQERFADLPVWKQMEYLPETGPSPIRGGTSEPPITNLGSETAVKSPAPRIAGKAPTLEDALIEALTSGEEEKPSLSTSAPAIETAGEGAFRQSGKFGKSGNLGQAGGYSSGRPGINLTDEAGNDLGTSVSGPAERPSGPWDNNVSADGAPTSLDDAIHEALIGKLGGTASDAELHTGGDALTSEPPASGPAPQSSKIDPATLSKEDWLQLRRQYGAKKLSALTGVPADDIRATYATGPSRIPLEAEDRINAFNAKQAMDRDK